MPQLSSSNGLSAAGIFLIVLLSVAVVAFMAARSGGKGITTFVAGYFLFFAFGPVINYLTGNEIYFGIRISSIPAAAAGMGVALIGMCAAIFVVPQRQRFCRLKLVADDRIYPTATFLHVTLSAYAIFTIAKIGGSVANLNKTEKILAAGPYHYDYLLCAMLASAFFFTAVRTRYGRGLFYLHLATYISYCLLMDERDFIFVIVSLLLHSRLFREKVTIWAPLLTGSALFALATYLFAARSGEKADTAQALNQGSLLFVDSYIIERYPDFFPYRLGDTYIDAVAGLAPSWIVAPKPTLADELLQSYASGSSSGYGFSLTAEAYMNFGYLGILAIFFALAACQQKLINRSDHSLFWAYFSVIFAVAWMYAMRGESSQLLKVLLDGVLLYGFVNVTSWRRARSAQPRVSLLEAGRSRQPKSHADAT
ncbi:O-antigen polysaccharide polymerase Wzy [Actinoplanes sp. NPDC049316]|uniref:O-antigen polysaccharide polymerase Wzy n=1 Tax=Actinoplanes sp. NPDC049316 TaxID=3154727 RepID=UPI00342D12ED